MTLTINDTAMTSDQTAHTARQAPGREHLWEVSWLPGRALDRNSAITAMTLADLAGEHDLDKRHQLWPFIQGWAAELGLTGSNAVNRPPGPPAPAISTTGKASDPTPRRDSDHQSPSAARAEARTSRLSRAHLRSGADAGNTAIDRADQDSPGGRLAYSVGEAARLTGLSRNLLYDEMRRGNLAYVKVGRRRLITRQHLNQFLGIAS